MVTGSAWRKNNRRELRHSLGRFLAIVAIVALGVGFFAGLKVAQPAMLRTGSQYVQKTERFDYRLVSTLGLTQEDADYFAGLDGVRAAEGARSVDLTAEFEDEGMTLKALTLSDAVNRPSLTAGRMPERADECLADADRFTEADLGKTLTVQAASVNDAFTQTAFTIVGLAETPLYLGAERGTTSLGGGTLNGFVLLQPEAFAMDYFTEIYLLLDGTQGTDLYSDAYDAAVDAVRPALTAALKERAQKRYDDIIDEARDALSKAQKEYDDGLAEYQERRAQTEQELADARSSTTARSSWNTTAPASRRPSLSWPAAKRSWRPGRRSMTTALPPSHRQSRTRSTSSMPHRPRSTPRRSSSMTAASSCSMRPCRSRAASSPSALPCRSRAAPRPC